MGQIGNERQINQKQSPFWNHLVKMTLLSLALWGIVGCNSSAPQWTQAEESCIYESENPPLRRVVNYSNPDLCDRHAPEKVKRHQRLRELFKE